MDRMKMLFEKSRKKAMDPPASSFQYDLHDAAKNRYADLPTWEKQARSMAYAIVNQEIYIDPDDKLIGRTYYLNEKKVTDPDSDLDTNRNYVKKNKEEDPEFEELFRYQMVNYGAFGHIAWTGI